MRAALLLLLAVQSVFAATCFLTETSTTPYIAMSVTIEESVKWCYTVCDSTPGCISVVYNATDGSCVKQSASPNLASQTCAAPYTRHYMTDVGCPYGDPMALMGTDPCAKHMPFLLEYQSEGTNKVCPQRKCDGTTGPLIIIRYRDESGVLQTYDNCIRAALTYDAATKKWKLYYFDKIGQYTVYATAVACASITNAAACPCPPLLEFKDPGLDPKGPILTETIPSCPPPYYPVALMKNSKTGSLTYALPNVFRIFCLGSTWIGCDNVSTSLTSMKIGGCGSPVGWVPP